jgi:hypothetical protein
VAKGEGDSTARREGESPNPKSELDWKFRKEGEGFSIVAMILLAALIFRCAYAGEGRGGILMETPEENGFWTHCLVSKFALTRPYRVVVTFEIPR